MVVVYQICRRYRTLSMIFCLYDDFRLTHLSHNTLPIFHPEFGRFMLEATPGKPWGIGSKDLLNVEPNMRLRYVVVHA